MFSYDKLLTLQKQQAEGTSQTTGGGTLVAAVPGGGQNQIATNAPWILKNAQVINMGLGVANSFMGTPKEYEGLRGGTTQTIDGFTDAAASVASQFGPVGQYVGMGLQANKLLGGVAKKFGAGTDGMCVCAGTKVFTCKGELKNIEDLIKEDGIIGWNQDTKQISQQKIHDIITISKKECVEIKLKNGYSLRCSIDHPILSDISDRAKSRQINGNRIAVRDWKFREAGNLKVGNFVGLANDVNYWGNLKLNNAYLVGLLIGDGSYSNSSSCRIISADKDTWDYLENNNLGIINHCDDKRQEKYAKEIRTYRIINGTTLMRELGLFGQVGEQKTLPKNIELYDKESICELLAGLFDTDGSLSMTNDKISITLYQSNFNLLNQVRIQLHKLGIFSQIGERKENIYTYKSKEIHSNKSYRLCITETDSIKLFCKLIPLNIGYKAETAKNIYISLKDKQSREHYKLSGARQSKIVSITSIGIQEVYNLQADNDHTYLANFIITHNTSTDAILGSSILQMTPLGLINGFGGKRANTFLQDKYTQSQSQFSYGGTNRQFADAAMKSGKKYGMFSSGARKEANWEIDAAGRRQNQLKYLIKDRDIANESMAGSTDIYNTGYVNELMGGYQPLMAAKQGAKINAKALSKAKRVASKMRATNKMKPVEELKQGGSFEWDISMFQDGGKSKRKYSFGEYYNIVKPKNQEEESWYDYKGHYNDDDFYPEWEQKYEEWTKLPDNEEKDLNFPHSTDKYKTDKHPTYSDKGYGWIGSDEDGWQFFVSPRQRAERSFEDYIKYWDEAEPKDILVYSPTQTYKKGDNFTKNVASHKQGGTIIPEGALHKNLNHLGEVNPDLKGEVTTKGIPIISEEGGQITQHAEIESGEIIFQKSVTEKLEELYKKYNEEGATESEKDELAIKAGKIITCEIMKHTDDKVGLINPEEI